MNDIIIYFEVFQERLSAWDYVDYFGLAGLTLRKAQTECFVISLTQKCDHEKKKKRKYLEVKNKNIWSSIKWENLVSFSCYHDHDKEDEA